MVDKTKLKLMALTGQKECFLEIKFMPSGDIFVELRGHNTLGEFHSIGAQVPNPINGGGNLEDYKALREIYDIIKKYEHGGS